MTANINSPVLCAVTILSPYFAFQRIVLQKGHYKCRSFFSKYVMGQPFVQRIDKATGYLFHKTHVSSLMLVSFFEFVRIAVSCLYSVLNEVLCEA